MEALILFHRIISQLQSLKGMLRGYREGIQIQPTASPGQDSRAKRKSWSLNVCDGYSLSPSRNKEICAPTSPTRFCLCHLYLRQSCHTQFFTLSPTSQTCPLSLMHKAHRDSGPLHMLFPGPPALSRVFLKVLLAYHWDLSAKSRWESPAGQKL